jgi:hypothetical protein
MAKYELLRIVDAIIFLGSLGYYTADYGAQWLFSDEMEDTINE